MSHSRYGPIVDDHVAAPRGAGAMEAADAIGRATNDACGDHLVLYFALDGEQIVDVRFQATGCPPAIAIGSLLVERLRGATVGDALTTSGEALEEALGGLPRGKRHVLALARAALNDALDYIYRGPEAR